MRHFLTNTPAIQRLAAAIACFWLVGSTAPAAAQEVADLEERVAELEATTARKGNRKVSLTISGWVAEQIMWWDDGFRRGAYVTGLGTTLGTHVRISGEAKIAPGWSAGYVLRVEADGSDSRGLHQNTYPGTSILSGTTNYVQTMASYWFVRNETLGSVSIGLREAASAKAAMTIDASGSMEAANYQMFDYQSFGIATNLGAINTGTWSAFVGCPDCNDLPLNLVRYDSPVLAGFSASWSWGADDYWDADLRYAGTVGSFKIGAAAGYARSTSSGVLQVANAFAPAASYVQTGLYLEHIPTGLFAYGAYQYFEYELKDKSLSNDNHEIWYGKAGIRQQWTALGHSVLYAEYERSNDGAIADFVFQTGSGSATALWGLGFVQEIDAAAMSLFVSYRHLSADYTPPPGQTFVGYEDFAYVKAGARIDF